jgi:hypothetical protein
MSSLRTPIPIQARAIEPERETGLRDQSGGREKHLEDHRDPLDEMRETVRELTDAAIVFLQSDFVDLRICLTKAERLGYVTRNVAKLVELPALAHREMRCLTPEQAQSLLNALEVQERLRGRLPRT